jgi:hypothetical protein
MRPKLWTKAGLSNLGQLIRLCRKSRKLSSEDAAAFIYSETGEAIASRTLLSIETATGKPEYNTLAIIAAAGFVKKNGKVLDIWDFINIASESESEPNTGVLPELIYAYLEKNNLDFEGFSRICGVTAEDLRAIASGNQTQDYEGDLILLSGYLDNPVTGQKFSNHPELMEYCFGKKDAKNKEAISDQDFPLNSFHNSG